MSNPFILIARIRVKKVKVEEHFKTTNVGYIRKEKFI